MTQFSVFLQKPNYLKVGANLAMTTFNLSQICCRPYTLTTICFCLFGLTWLTLAIKLFEWLQSSQRCFFCV